MRQKKAKWKRAPMDQRRVTSDRTIPNARFTRSKLSGSLPSPLRGENSGRSRKPLIAIAGALLLLVGLSVTLVIAIGTFMRVEGENAEIRRIAAYYGRPTLPFATLPPDVGRVGGTSAPVNTTALPFNTTPLPGIADLGSSGDFPILAADDDPRWVQGTITPLASSFDLRAIPTLLNNNPLATITQESPGWFITNDEWDGWAQVKIDGVTGWIDTATVRLTAA